MHFTSERARDNITTAAQVVESRFGALLSGKTDADYIDAARSHAIGATGLEFDAPVCMHLVNDPVAGAFIDSFADTDQLFDFSDGVKHFTADGQTALDSDLAARLSDIFQRSMKSRGYIDPNGDHIIDLKTYPVGSHYNVNLLIGNRSGYEYPLLTTPKSAMDSLGRGSFRSGGSAQVLATRCVLQLEENGEPANRQFYIVEDNKQIFYSADVNHNVKTAQCRHSQNHTVITYETECGLKITRTIFILPQEPGAPEAVEAQRVTVENLSDRQRRLKIVMTGMFGITVPETIANDVVYANVVIQTELFGKDGKPVALSLHHKDANQKHEKRFAMLLSAGETLDDFCTSLPDFIGSGTLNNPEVLTRLPNRHSRKMAPFFAMGKWFDLPAGKSRNIDSLVGMMTMPDRSDVTVPFDNALQLLYTKYNSDSALADALEKVKNDWEGYSSYLRPKTDDPMFDAYVGHNLPFQVWYQTFVSRAFAWTQKSYRETGFREIQDIFASMYYMAADGKADLAKELISMWVANVYRMGYANHDFTWVGKEPGDCSDDQLWLIQAVHRYVTLTGDYGFLDEEYPIAGEDAKRSLWDTMQAILEYSGKISVGKHGLPLLDKADWNDTLRLDKTCLKGPAKEALYREQLEQKGQPYGVAWENTLTESVMNACLLKIAADAVADMAKTTGREADGKAAAEMGESVRKSMQDNCWIGDFFARAMINDDREGGYTYMGAGKDRLSADPSIDGTYFLNSYSWPILANVATEEQIATMLEVVNKYLRTDAGLKLCTLVQYELLGCNTATALYFPGDRENGGVFKHAAMMATVASLRAAKWVKDKALAARLTELAHYMIRKTLPYTTLDTPYITKGNPRFCTQYNNSETGENIGPILSGTSSWLSLAIFEQLGLDVRAEGIAFTPILTGEADHLAYELNLEGTVIAVEISGSADRRRVTEQTRFIYDGTPVSGRISVVRDGGRHQLNIEL